MKIITLPEYSAYQLVVTEECSSVGSGDCDGFSYEEGNEHAECGCPCHYATNLPTWTAGVTEWHTEMHKTGGKNVE